MDLQGLNGLSLSLTLVGPADSNLSSRNAVSLDEVADKPLILTPRPDGLRTLIETEFASIGRRARVAVETEYAPMDDLIRRNVGFAIIPYCGMVNSPLTQFVWALIENLHVTWLIASLQSADRTLAALRFKEMLLASTKENVRSGHWKAIYLGKNCTHTGS